MLLRKFRQGGRNTIAKKPSKGTSFSTRPSNSLRLLSVRLLDSDEDVQDFMAENGKSILLFTSSWCGPCKKMKPLYEQLSKKFDDIAFGKVDVDENAESAMNYEVSAVPTFIIFEGDQLVERLSGADASKLEQLIESLQER